MILNRLSKPINTNGFPGLGTYPYSLNADRLSVAPHTACIMVAIYILCIKKLILVNVA
jgi:hypothetical protein